MKKPSNLKQLDAWIAKNPQQDKGGPYMMSRYQALKKLFGEKRADQIMRDLEVASWDLPKAKKKAAKKVRKDDAPDLSGFGNHSFTGNSRGWKGSGQ